MKFSKWTRKYIPSILLAVFMVNVVFVFVLSKHWNHFMPQVIRIIYTLNLERSPLKGEEWRVVGNILNQDNSVVPTSHQLLSEKNQLANQSGNGIPLKFHNSMSQNLTDFLAQVEYFKMSREDKELYMKTIKTCFKFLRQHKIEFFAHAGTLMGSYMHHGFIPWDDDMDIWMSFDMKRVLMKLFNHTKPDFPLVLHTGNPSRWKIYLKNGSHKTQYQAWKWPFIDVSFWYHSGDAIIDDPREKWRYRIKDVYPIIERPFEGERIPVPRHGYKYIAFGVDNCCTGSYDHRNEIGVPERSKCIPCSLLTHLYPFVTRKAFNSTHNKEILTMGSNVLHTSLELII